MKKGLEDDVSSFLETIRCFYSAVQTNSSYWLFDSAALPIPLPEEKKLKLAMEVFLSLDSEQQKTVRDAITEDIGERLMVYATRMASLAVRQSSQRILRVGFVAILVDNDVVDRRSVWTAVSVLIDAAKRIGTSNEVFADLIPLAVPARRKLLKLIIKADPDIHSMALEGTTSPNGFVYRRRSDWNKSAFLNESG